jgi:Caspase domain
MSKVIQATCPGCKKTLRIPAGWLHQAIRCKHCGLVMAAKQAAAATAAPAANHPTPAPPNRKAATSPPAAKAPSKSVRATPPTAGSAPVAKIAAPAAIPVAPLAGSTGSPFDNLDDPALNTTARRATRHGNSWWKGPVLALAVLFLGGVALAVIVPLVGLQRLLPQLAQIEKLEEKDDAKDSDSPSPSTAQHTEPVKQPDVPKKSDPKQPDPKKPDPGVKTPDPKKPDPKQPDPKKPDPDTKPPDIKKPDPKPAPPVGTLFPRRALVISVHNYLYANPVGAGLPLAGARNMSYFVTKLNTGLKVPANQIAHLSDEARGNKARAPVKQVIEQTLVDFLGNSREQDRVIVLFAGHAVEIDGDGYLVPIEGELDDAATLVPLKWVFEELKNCRARQKILVLDTNRFSPTRGLERPSSGPMSAKFDELLKKPPEGVQIWAACVAEQMSYETDVSPAGVFIDHLTTVLEKGVAGAPRPEDSIPIEKLNEAVIAGMKDELAKFKLTQTPRLSGKELEGGAPYDPKVSAPPAPKLADSKNNQTNVQLIKSVLTEIGTPPVKGSQQDATIKFEMLPPFSEKAMKNYDADEESALKGPIQEARAMLWAISTSNPPESLKEEVEKIRVRTKVNLSYLKDGFRAPQNENQFKTELNNQERPIADMIDEMEHAYKKLKSVEVDRQKEPKRWLANYDFIVARMEEQIAYLYEYQSVLGQMRKELPPLDKAQGNGWKLASTETLNGDSKGKKMAKSSAALLKKMAEEHKGTPWEVLAKREKLTTLGLELKTATVK